MMESIGFAMPGVGYLIGGIIVALADPRAAYAIAGAGVALLVCAVAIFRSRVFPEPAAPGLGEEPIPATSGPPPGIVNAGDVPRTGPAPS